MAISVITMPMEVFIILAMMRMFLDEKEDASTLVTLMTLMVVGIIII